MLAVEHEAARRAVGMVGEAARLAELDAAEATVIRVRTSIHVELPRAGVIARVEGPDGQQLAERQVVVARALATVDAPVARLIRPELQPLLVDGGAVTLWQQVRPVATPTIEAVGRAVRRIHVASAPIRPGGVPQIDPFTQVANCLDAVAPVYDARVVTELRRRADELSPRWIDGVAEDPLGRVIVHGDVHLDNAVVADSGVVLIDLEDAGRGPASWDFAPLALAERRYGAPSGELGRFAVGYGTDPTAWPGLGLMCDVYELVVTSWAIRCGLDSPAMAREAEVRVAGLLDDDPAQWTLL